MGQMTQPVPEVVSAGELVVDFVAAAAAQGLADTPLFVRAAGTAPADVAVGLARLGIRSGFLGQVGEDGFGHYLARTLVDSGVDVSRLRFSKDVPTPLAFITPVPGGDREFLFYSHPGGAMAYELTEEDLQYVRVAKAFHFGSVTLCGVVERCSTLTAARVAREAGVLVSYDPNVRLGLWPDAASAREAARLGWALAEVVKASEEEVLFCAEVSDAGEAVRRLWHDELRLVVVTRGASGCRFFTRAFKGELPAFPVAAVDTTGAGDAFMAGLLKGLQEWPHAPKSEAAVRSICRYASAVGALTTLERGAIPSLPSANAVRVFLKQSCVANE